MNDVAGEFYAPEQSPTTPAAVPSSPAKDSAIRPHGDMLKMMNPTPNGYSDVPNHKPKPEGQDSGKHHETKNNVDHHKHSSDHVKKKEHDESKHKSSSPSKSKESSKDSSKKEGLDGHRDKEKKHKSSHKESSKSKDSSHKHSEHQSKHSSEKKDDKHKSDSVKKEHQSSEAKPKTDNFKENEKIKESSSKEHKEKHKEHKEKHKDKHKDKEHKEKHKDKSSTSSSDKPKEKSDKPKEKSDKPKDENLEKHKEKDKEKHKDKHKDKHGEKHKDKHGEKHKDKSSEKHKDKSSEKHKDKSSEKHKDKNSEKHKEKSKEKHEEKSKEKHEEKSKEKHEEKSKEKHEEKSKEKHEEKSKEKHEEKSKEKREEKSKEKHEEKSKEKSKEKHIEKSEEKQESKHKDSVIIKQELEVEESVQSSFMLDALPSEDSTVKDEPLSDEDMPLMARKASMNASMSIKREAEDSDDEPISAKIEKKVKSEKKEKKKKPTSDDEDFEMKEEEEEEEELGIVEKKKSKKKRKADSDDDDYASKKPAKKAKKNVKKEVKKEKTQAKVKQEPTISTASPTKRKKKEEEELEVWKWWEEEKLEDGIKWKTLEHYGPIFAPPYERVPKNVKFYYDGKHIELSEVTEEVAGFYGKMLDHEYTSKEVFNTNFFKDWRKVMTPEEKEIITDLKKCNFNAFNDYYKMKSEERKAMTKEQKAVIKKENEELTSKYGFCIIDGHKQKIGNFRIEPPGLFRGRGEHPKMGMLKRRVEAEDILINIGKEAKVPDPPPGHKWKEVRHDNTVSWLASWAENILGSTKYIMLNPSSKLKGEKDWQKYETARKLKQHASRIREEYTRDFKSKEMKVRQRAVALYFIDKLALRAGNEKDEDTADTVGCCSLRVEHITLDDEKDGQEYVVSFDFLGKDSIRYFNSVAVEKRAYKNLKLFMENKQPGDDLFDRLNTAILNKYLNDLMEGLTAKVFRTYNASKTLQEQLDLLTKEDMSLPEKILAYNRANRAVAILCNHQRAVPKGFSKAMDTLKQKMDDKIAQIKDFRKEVKEAKKAAKDGGPKDKMILDKKKKRLSQLEEQLKKLDVQATDKEENKQIALGTSKLNYLDPRISVAWCKKWGVPIEKVYNRTQRDKFRWAIEMAGPDYKF